MLDSEFALLGRSIFLPPRNERRNSEPILAIYVPAHAVTLRNSVFYHTLSLEYDFPMDVKIMSGISLYDIKERIMMGNKAYYANTQLFNSSLISRNSKLQIYRTLVRPVVTYVSESWTHTMEEERALAVFERKILRKIYGPVKENDGEFDKTMN